MLINIESRQDGVGLIYNRHGDMTVDDFFRAVLMEQVGWETITFRSRAEAEAWIRQRAKLKFGLDVPLTSAAP